MYLFVNNVYLFSFFVCSKRNATASALETVGGNSFNILSGQKTDGECFLSSSDNVMFFWLLLFLALCQLKAIINLPELT